MNKIREMRRKKGLRQLDLSLKANISLSWLWFLENGLESRVSKEIKERVSEALECDYQDLFPSE
jgi:transcriptional regulator with XRE-family HTH domain